LSALDVPDIAPDEEEPMPVIHHPELKREMTVSEAGAVLWTTEPRSPWKRGPLPAARKKSPRPTANTPSSPKGDPDPSEED
jgi:hypothetical protein